MPSTVLHARRRGRSRTAPGSTAGLSCHQQTQLTDKGDGQDPRDQTTDRHRLSWKHAGGAETEHCMHHLSPAWRDIASIGTEDVERERRASDVLVRVPSAHMEEAGFMTFDTVMSWTCVREEGKLQSVGSSSFQLVPLAVAAHSGGSVPVLVCRSVSSSRVWTPCRARVEPRQRAKQQSYDSLHVRLIPGHSQINSSL
ncbi:unnamed protein product [Pleuronectes platessa]|uniref:Uncharacterized protein n=1 Tax=Pleuronectes platessa TaxID=8262 RepID=A0A9N7UVR8_PLEPL|nr:unnamed protein product [Pleuronectes platessa]